MLTTEQITEALDTLTTEVHRGNGSIHAAYGRVASLPRTEPTLDNPEGGERFDLSDPRQIDELASKYPRHNETLTEAIRTTQRTADRLGGELARLERELPPPVVECPTSHQSRAADLLPIIRAEVDTATLTALRDRVRTARTTGDVATQYALLLTLPTRLASASPKATSSGTVSWSDDTAETERVTRELRSLLSQMRESFTVDHAAEARERLNTLRSGVGKMRAKAEERERVRRGYSWQSRDANGRITDVSWGSV